MDSQRGGRAAGEVRACCRVPELLAPAGGPEALLAAVAAGADAVYLGLSAFSARESAENFSPAQLAASARLAHAHGVRVYAALNVHLLEGEVPRALAAARTALGAGADALIVADWGLAAALRRELPQAELHLSTQANVQAAPGLELARQLGFARVTTSRELSAAEIAALVAEAHGRVAGRGAQDGARLDVEVFCHGAICICYAGCCELSAHLRGRSANRGACVQPCRFNWELCRWAPGAEGESANVAARAGADEGWEVVSSVPGEKLLCPRDLCALGWLPQLVRAGVAALKVEGRMKNPDYVYNVVRAYRTALDVVFRNGADVTHGDTGAAGGACGDGAAPAYARADGDATAHGARADASGGPAAGDGAAGSPLAPLPYDADALRFRVGLSFNRGFTDAYLAGRPDGRMMSYERAINQGVRVGELVARDHRTVTVRLERPVWAGDTLEIRFYPDMAAKVHGPKRWPMVEAPRDAPAGAEIALYVKRRVDPPCAVYCVRSARVLAETEAALAPLRAELAQCEKDVAAAGAFGTGSAPAGEKDRCARAVFSASARTGACGSERGSFPSGLLVMGDAADLPHAASDAGRARCVLARTPAEARDALAAGAAAYAEAWRMADDAAAWEPLRGRVAVVLNEMLRPGEEDAARALIAHAGRVVCRNLSQVALARGAGVEFEVMAPLVARNAEAVRLFGRWGARAVWLPREMGAAEVRALRAALRAGIGSEGEDGRQGDAPADAAPAPAIGVMSTRAAQVMVCAHCLLQAEGPCNRACAACARRRVPHALRGAGGELLHVETDRTGVSRLFARDKASEAMFQGAAGSGR